MPWAWRHTVLALQGPSAFIPKPGRTPAWAWACMESLAQRSSLMPSRGGFNPQRSSIHPTHHSGEQYESPAHTQRRPLGHCRTRSTPRRRCAQQPHPVRHSSRYRGRTGSGRTVEHTRWSANLHENRQRDRTLARLSFRLSYANAGHKIQRTPTNSWTLSPIG